ncbi:ArsR family transcriptional regulator [Algoriphagus sp. CAU 1675]|uniref:ArsR family transcriptional regulator n=1 Tax=Algoriphagus sp. CAU 1675 TaxID=3032597 RepID=UPI0023DB96DB|nr:ArsR family transcriptional regulator [Algoriphagus sp. CAU 1675]MDF2158201.1 ArsR family transcriptional regulator [Algoriphagus sp. CAU 1675]
MLNSLITSKTRLRLLVKFFSNPKNQGHLRGLAEEFGESTNAIRKELNNLSDAGLLVKINDKNKIDYQANINHPLFSNLQDLIRKYLGFDKLLSTVLERMGNVTQVALVGDYARGLDSGEICVEICGEDLDGEYLLHLSERIKESIQRKVSFEIREEITDQEALILFEK